MNKRIELFDKWKEYKKCKLNLKKQKTIIRKGNNVMKDYRIAVAGTGYVGLSIATLLSQHHQVTAVDVIPEKVER